MDQGPGSGSDSIQHGSDLAGQGDENVRNGFDHVAPTRGFPLETGVAARCQVVKLGAPVVFGGPPLGLDEAPMLEPLEGGVEGALVHVEHALRQLLDPLADAPAVHRLQAQGLEDQEVQGAAQDLGVGIFGGHG